MLGRARHNKNLFGVEGVWTQKVLFWRSLFFFFFFFVTVLQKHPWPEAAALPQKPTERVKRATILAHATSHANNTRELSTVSASLSEQQTNFGLFWRLCVAYFAHRTAKPAGWWGCKACWRCKACWVREEMTQIGSLNQTVSITSCFLSPFQIRPRQCQKTPSFFFAMVNIRVYTRMQGIKITLRIR